MKIKQKYCVLIVLFFELIGVVKSQTLPYALRDFSFKQVDNRIRAFWTINEGYSCQAVKIEISKDTLNFKTIYTYPGICGLGQEEASYQHIFSSPFQSAYYRLNLGIYGNTKPFHIILKQNKQGGILLYPNPVKNQLNISLGTNHQKKITLKIMNSLGKIIFTSNSLHLLSFSINTQKWNNGFYIIYTEDKNRQKIDYQRFVITH